MTTCDRECEACPHVDNCDMHAAYEYRAEIAAEDFVEAPAKILSCDCHAGIELRLCELEDLVSRMRREMTRGVEL